MYHAMNIYGITLDMIAHRPVVILKNTEDTDTVPIWISAQEAVSIAAELFSSDVSSQHGRSDLLSMLLEKMGMKVAQISIDGLKDGVFSASVRFDGDGALRLDIRPFEALSLALKYKMPVMVADAVMERASLLAMGDETIARENDARRFVEFLENLDPADLGKYPM
jgi:uncharacterized protein